MTDLIEGFGTAEFLVTGNLNKGINGYASWAT